MTIHTSQKIAAEKAHLSIETNAPFCFRTVLGQSVAFMFSVLRSFFCFFGTLTG